MQIHCLFQCIVLNMVRFCPCPFVCLSFLSRYGAIERTPCVVHTLQLVVNLLHKEVSVRRLFEKVQELVKLFRRSSVATERLLKLCGLTLVKDCPIRWSSTYTAISHLLQLKNSLIQVVGLGLSPAKRVAEDVCSQEICSSLLLNTPRCSRVIQCLYPWLCPPYST